MPEIRIKISDEPMQKALTELAKKMADRSPVMKVIGEYMVRSTESRFRSQGPAPDGKLWAPLKASTRSRKKHPKTLTESGALRGDIHYRLQGSSGVAIGTTERIPYAAIHQLGGTVERKARTGVLAFGRGGGFMSRAAASKKRTGAVRIAFANYQAGKSVIPARPFLGVSAKDSTEIVGIINTYLGMR